MSGASGKVPAAIHYSYSPENNLTRPAFGLQGGRTAIAGVVYRAPEEALDAVGLRE